MYCKKIIYYNDELNDDFATIDNLEKKKIDDKYNYFRHNNILYKFFADTLYFVIAKPLTKIMMLLIYHNFIHGRFKILKAKKTGFFVYANHTNILPDAYTPNHIYHRRNYIITARDTVSIKGVGVIVDALGAIPLPDTIKAAKNFKESINKNLQLGFSRASGIDGKPAPAPTSTIKVLSSI